MYKFPKAKTKNATPVSRKSSEDVQSLRKSCLALSPDDLYMTEVKSSEASERKPLHSKLDKFIFRIQFQAHCVIDRMNSVKVRTILANNRGGIFNNALDLVLDIVVGALILAGVVALFNSNVLPSVKTGITNMFNAGS